MVAVSKTGRKIMSQFIAPSELTDLTEQELRALHRGIINDLRGRGQAVQDCSDIYASLRNIEAAILRLQLAVKPRGPRPPRP